MDATRFDQFAQSLARATRRGLLGSLTTLPVLSGVAALLGDPGVAAGKKRRKKKCKRTSRARICAGKCGVVKNRRTCKKKVDCGSCTCDPSCAACETCQSDGTCSAPCGGTGCCDGATCHAGETNAACGMGGAPCQTCSGGDSCWDGACVCGDVCANGCQFSTIQAVIDAVPVGGTATIRLCAGTYPRAGTANIARIDGKNLTLLGAGADVTILDGGGILTGEAVVFANRATATLQQLTVTGANGTAGIFLGSEAALTLSEAIVRGNDYDEHGGGITNQGGEVILNAGARISGNHADGRGGGIYTSGGTVTLNASASISDNDALLGAGIYNSGGDVTLNDGASVVGNDVDDVGGGIYDGIGGTVTLDAGSLVCGNTPNQCIGFTDPNGACQDICP
ncbi:MAG: hypothetical protein KC442_09400, partial [Thermomicrobiales bacterium]|nr:hypothetical protein [Thermomicrobiales bacterium]